MKVRTEFGNREIYYLETLLGLHFEELCEFLQFQHNKKNPVMNSNDINQIIKISNGFKEKVKRSLKQVFEKSRLKNSKGN